MPNGMRFDNDAIRALPPIYQEQVAVKYAAELAKATRVAGKEEKRPIKLPVKRLCFRGRRAAVRYRDLREAVRQGVISELDLVEYDGNIVAFTYKIVWGGEFIPTGLPVRTLVQWRGIGKNRKVREIFK